MSTARALFSFIVSVMLLVSLFVFVGAPKNTETLEKLSRGLPPWAEDGFLLEDGETMILLDRGWIVMHQADRIGQEGVHTGVKYEWISKIDKNGSTYTVHNDEYDNYDLVFTPASGFESDAERVIAKVQAELDQMEVVEE